MCAEVSRQEVRSPLHQANQLCTKIQARPTLCKYVQHAASLEWCWEQQSSEPCENKHMRACMLVRNAL